MREGAEEGPAVGAGSVTLPSEYVCTLQPPDGSALGLELAECRRSSSRELGVDEANLYPPHISVSGFFQATPWQAAEVCEELRGLVPEHAQDGSLLAEVRGVVATGDGHVILDVSAPGVAALAAVLAARVARLGVRLRPKAVRHLSLGKGRSPREQATMARLHAGLPFGCCELDLVVAQLTLRSDVPRLRSEGKAHVFQELLRLRLPGGEKHPLFCPLPAQVSTLGDACTPVRKRRAEAAAGEAFGMVIAGRHGAEGTGTPPKVANCKGAHQPEPSKEQRLK